jgi:3-methyl-2-oxobutanoate hydroxymethyltransferase
MVPQELAAQITAELKIPTIGIGAGAGCDGQVLVIYDLLGMNPSFSPKFVKKYVDLGVVISEAVMRYRDEVKHGTFPAAEHSFTNEPASPAAAAKATADGGTVLQLYSVAGK